MLYISIIFVYHYCIIFTARALVNKVITSEFVLSWIWNSVISSPSLARQTRHCLSGPLLHMLNKNGGGGGL